MEIEIALDEIDYKRSIVDLKTTIDKKGIAGMERTAFEHKKLQGNEQGVGDILNSIRAWIEAAEKPLAELVVCLQKYVDNYGTRIIIPSRRGKDIILEHGRSMTPEQLKEIVEIILQNNSHQH